MNNGNDTAAQGGAVSGAPDESLNTPDTTASAPTVTATPPAPATPKNTDAAPTDTAGTKGAKDAGSAPSPVTGEQMWKMIQSMPASEYEDLMNHLGEAAGVDYDAGTHGSVSDDDDDDDDDDGEYDTDDSSFTADQPGKGEKRTVSYDDMEPGLKKAVLAVHGQLLDGGLKEALDSDKELSYNMRNHLTAEGTEAVRSVVKDKMNSLVSQAGDSFDYDWTKVAKQAISAMKPTIMALMDRKSRAGVGASPGNDGIIGRELKEPPRVPAFADDEERVQYLQERLAYNRAVAARNQQVPENLGS